MSGDPLHFNYSIPLPRCSNRNRMLAHRLGQRRRRHPRGRRPRRRRQVRRTPVRHPGVRVLHHLRGVVMCHSVVPDGHPSPVGAGRDEGPSRLSWCGVDHGRHRLVIVPENVRLMLSAFGQEGWRFIRSR